MTGLQLGLLCCFSGADVRNKNSVLDDKNINRNIQDRSRQLKLVDYANKCVINAGTPGEEPRG